MGADGHITLWKREDADKAFPDEAHKLFELLPNCYLHGLDGREYYHAYHGDNMYSDWRDSQDWISEYPDSPPIERQKEFSQWLHANTYGAWEVWT